MTVPEKPVVYYVAFFVTSYESLDDAIARAPDVVAAHQARSKELHARGTLLMSAAFLMDQEATECGWAGWAQQEPGVQHIQEAAVAAKPFLKRKGVGWGHSCHAVGA